MTGWPPPASSRTDPGTPRRPAGSRWAGGCSSPAGPRRAPPRAPPRGAGAAPSARGLPMGWGVFFACWAAAAAVALALGRDASWDLRHYHYYNAYALLEGRWAVDLAPARAHSFPHPALAPPFYLLTRSPLNAWPRAVSVLQAGYAGVLAFLALAVANLACHGAAGRATAASGLVACFGLTGAATLPEGGTGHHH